MIVSASLEAKKEYINRWNMHVDDLTHIALALGDTPEFEEMQKIITRSKELVKVASENLKTNVGPKIDFESQVAN